MAHKLTDTQLVILSQAAQHPERAVVVPDRLRGGAVAKVVGPLLAKGLVEEVACRQGLVEYRTGEDETPTALLITPAGLETLGIEVQEPAQADPTPKRSRRVRTSSRVEETGAAPATTPRTSTKQDMLIALLRRPEGATVQEVIAATGWQAHTVRGPSRARSKNVSA